MLTRYRKGGNFMRGWKRYVLEVLAILFIGAALCASSYFLFGVSRAGVKDIAAIFISVAIIFPPLDRFVEWLKRVPKS